MGFFSLKTTCAICGESCGLNRFQTTDGLWCCAKCFKKAGLSLSSAMISSREIKKLVEQNKDNADKLDGFRVTKRVPGWLYVDESTHEWYCMSNLLGSNKSPHIHTYEEILDFELLEDGDSIVKGGLGRAVVGGILFGGVGAVVGGATGKRKSKTVCTSLKIKISLDNMVSPVEYIDMIATPTKKESPVYQRQMKAAQEILSILQIMCETNEKATEKTPESTKVDAFSSSADEIMKFKQLLDSGIISQEEFDAKKKQLLDL